MGSCVLLAVAAIASAASLHAAPPAPTPPAAAVPADHAADVIEVRLRVVRTTHVPDPKSLLPYRKALAAEVCEVVEVLSGKAPAGRRILVATWVVGEGERLPPTVPLRTWRRARVRLVPFESRRDLANQKLLVELEEFDLPMYVIVR